MNVMNRAVAVLLTAMTAAIAVPAEAAVMFHAFDSKGKDTGTCAERVSGGYALKTCDKTSAAQRFNFDVNGANGNTIEQPNECLVAISLTPLANVGGRACNGTNFVAKLWRNTNGTQIVSMPDKTMCLSAAGSITPRLVVQVCNAPALLTQWRVDQVK